VRDAIVPMAALRPRSATGSKSVQAVINNWTRNIGLLAGNIPDVG